MTLPKVSAVMPACYGELAAVAIDCFLAQTYENRELVVLDNNRDGETIESLCCDPRIRYYRCERMTTGALRNKVNALASGDVIAHWDCDDWYSKDRVAAQVERLNTTGKAATGWHSLLFYDTATGRAYRYKYAAAPPYATGTSLCYMRAWWAEHPFQPIRQGEDYYFQLGAAQAAQLDSTDAGHLCVMRAHRDSTCPPMLGCSQIPAVPITDLPEAFFP